MLWPLYLPYISPISPLYLPCISPVSPLQESSWASVLWPLWALGGFIGASLLLGVCCGVPLLLRREMHS